VRIRFENIRYWKELLAPAILRSTGLRDIVDAVTGRKERKKERKKERERRKERKNSDTAG